MKHTTFNELWLQPDVVNPLSVNEYCELQLSIISIGSGQINVNYSDILAIIVVILANNTPQSPMFCISQAPQDHFKYHRKIGWSQRPGKDISAVSRGDKKCGSKAWDLLSTEITK
jgi:hypothetical protein